MENSYSGHCVPHTFIPVPPEPITPLEYVLKFKDYFIGSKYIPKRSDIEVDQFIKDIKNQIISEHITREDWEQIKPRLIEILRALYEAKLQSVPLCSFCGIHHVSAWDIHYRDVTSVLIPLDNLLAGK